MPLTKYVIGTSGWQYQDWNKIFYPKNLPNHQQLNFYSQQFNTVEINNTFYTLPSPKVFQTWRAAVHTMFTFSLKANQYLTHYKKLSAGDEALEKFLNRVRILGPKLGPILFQLPPYWQLNFERLQTFIKNLPADLKYVFEFRHSSWYQPQVLKLLASYHVVLCWHDHAQGHSPWTQTADFIYLRLHGPLGNYQTPYQLKELKDWAYKLKQIKVKSVFVYFNNDYHMYAIKNAKQLIKLLT